VTSDADPRMLVERALDQTAAVIEAIPVGLAGAPTPCPACDVRALDAYLVPSQLPGSR